MTGSLREVTAYRGAADWSADDSSARPTADPSASARQQRALADARMQAFAAGTSHAALAPPTVEAPPSGPAAEHPVLFQRQAGDVDAIDPGDIRQGTLGDCYLLATVGAMARTPRGRDQLRNAVVEDKDEGGNVVSYTVTLHEVLRGRFGRTTARDIPVTVDANFPAGHAVGRSADGRTEIWPLVLEKACAKYLGGYDALGAGGRPSDAMTLLTGRPATSVSLGWPSRLFHGYSETDLKSDLANGKLIVLSSRADIAKNTPPATGLPEGGPTPTHGIVASHAYFVKSTEQRNGKTFVVLGDSWNRRDLAPPSVPFDELAKWFSHVSLGSLP